jgi:LPS O-antigen subunit length determinant protein (WzzB/FepE family)
MSKAMTYLLWQGKFWIAGLALLGGLIGFTAASVWPKRYEATVVLRSSEPASFVPFSALLTEMPGEWHQTSNITATAQQLFLQLARDRNNLEAFVLSHRALFEPGLDLKDRQKLLEVIDDLELSSQRSAIPYLLKRDSADGPSLRLDFNYAEGSRGVEFLNNYVEDLISQTNSRLVGNARNTLQSVRESRERELLKLREMRDLRARQSILEYEEALATARAAGIEQPAIANLGSAAAVVATNSPAPLYYYGTVILAAELKKVRARIGNDLAIPEFAAIGASVKDIDNRMAALGKFVLQPVVVTETAAAPTRPKSPRRGLISLLGFLLGAFAGFLLMLVRVPKVQRSYSTEPAVQRASAAT